MRMTWLHAHAGLTPRSQIWLLMATMEMVALMPLKVNGRVMERVQDAINAESWLVM